jgi:hypothetical protein
VKRRIALLPGLLVTAALAGCSATHPHQGAGPLGYPGNPHNRDILCLPDLHGQPETVGIDVIRNNGHAPLVIDRFALSTPRHLALVGGYVVPGRFAVGQWESFPPPVGKLTKGVQWASRHAPAGARVLSGHYINPVLGLKPTGHIGSTAAAEVFYHVGSVHYVWKSPVKIFIKVPPANCS